MRDADCVAFLQWALPRLQMRWAGFRKPRRQVCRRLARRLTALALEDLTAYRRRLESDSAEWAVLNRLCRVTISRFFRDLGLWRVLAADVLPRLAQQALARDDDRLRAWSVGCASGEEAYSLAILWRLAVAPGYPGLALEILATDVDITLLARARRGVYRPTSLRDLPSSWIDLAFEPAGGADLRVRDEMRDGIRLLAHDLRSPWPRAAFDLVACRNLAFTYYDARLQRRVLGRIRSRLRPGGVLLIGSHEGLPERASLSAVAGSRAIFTRPHEPPSGPQPNPP